MTASSPPATRSQTASSWALPCGVKRRYDAGSTAATEMTRFWIAMLPRPITSVPSTPAAAATWRRCSAVNGSALDTRRSAPASPSVSGPGGDTAWLGSTTVGVAEPGPVDADVDGEEVETEGPSDVDPLGASVADPDGPGVLAGAEPQAAATRATAASSSAPRRRDTPRDLGMRPPSTLTPRPPRVGRRGNRAGAD
ncbi:hypothetical protein [Nocardioides sp.]|uniref:hypothetical protein n=1 Tax=Nocardioides sp. TaxID=35761 RepID=UPI0035278D97